MSEMASRSLFTSCSYPAHTLPTPCPHPVHTLFTPPQDGEVRVSEMADGIPDGFMGLDCGPKSIAMNAEVIKKSKTVIWKGPMGVFEMAKFESGTKASIFLSSTE